MTEDWREAGFGVYIHWPFCLAKCPYCDFNSHVAGGVDHAAWSRALVAGLGTARDLTGSRRADTLFFGGGTPSLMPPATVAACIDAVDRLWGLGPDAEITLEANPTSVEAGRFAAYAAAGVNRVSMGVQALNDRDLKALGRTHTAAEARAAFAVARRTFARVSFDLIYARQGQSLDAWRAELDAALEMAADHLSLYQLTIEPDTAFGALHERGRLRGLPGDGLAADMYEATQEISEAAGLPAYEISNHARPGAEGRHNLIYWRGGDYVGLGPGAHGRVTTPEARLETTAAAAPAEWMAAPTRIEAAPLPPGAAADEYALTALRLAEGMDLDRHARLAGAALEEDRIAALDRQGLVWRRGRRLGVTTRGRPILNAVLGDLLA